MRSIWVNKLSNIRKLPPVMRIALATASGGIRPSVDPTRQLNRAACQADFTYTMTVNVIKIQDTGKEAKSVAEDLEAVLRKIENWPQGSRIGFRIMYRDSDGYWDGVQWNGQHATFFAIRETSEAAAERKLLANKAE